MNPLRMMGISPPTWRPFQLAFVLSVKEVEYEAFADAGDEMGADNPGGDFYARTLPRAQRESPWTQAIDRVVLVHRLREVVAQVGFTRFESGGTDTQGELNLNVQTAPLALGITWLPAVENRGEGGFLQINPSEGDVMPGYCAPLR